jgi:hypothetical protein
MNLELSEKKIFSQNGEDGITMKLLELYNKLKLECYIFSAFFWV